MRASRFLRCSVLIAVLIVPVGLGHAAEVSTDSPSSAIDVEPRSEIHDAGIRVAALTPRDPQQNAEQQGAPPLAFEPFSAFQQELSGGPLRAEWHAVQKDIERDEQLLDRCRADRFDCRSAAATFLLTIIDRARALQGRARIGEVNRSINLAIRPRSRFARSRAQDAWRGPLSALAAEIGDCKDYAVAKYVALRQAGVPDQDLRLVIIRDARVHENHAVVTVRLHGRWLVLDNRWLALAEDRELPRFTPLFSLGQDRVSRLMPPGELAAVLGEAGSLDLFAESTAH